MRKIPAEYENPIDNLMYNLSEAVSPTFHAYGFTPNMVTTLSNIAAIIVIILLLEAKYIWAAIFVMVAFFFDCLDGHIARKYKQFSKFGDYYDHSSDITKACAILFTMYWINSEKFFKVIPIIIIGFLLSFVQLGCQEKYYNTTQSESLDITRNLCPINDKESLEYTMKYTRYFGSGTSNLIFALSILYYDI
jgi:phosphatidylglycerophosphate synthase